ncbi:hypothetical protein LCGC14_2186050 [marine sediment metagenome]|uniref:Uncharacterized protein n=1 Tax=marine sediment metagenome TaxID=412755 RepID=A0A0F9GGR2_9ZZZZ
MVSKETENKVGEILFDMIATAMRERGLQMEFSKWGKVDGRVRENYMEIVKHIAEVIENSREPTNEEIIAARENLDEQEVKTSITLDAGSPELYVSDKDKAKVTT